MRNALNFQYLVIWKVRGEGLEGPDLGLFHIKTTTQPCYSLHGHIIFPFTSPVITHPVRVLSEISFQENQQPCGSQRSSVLKILDIHALDLLFKEGARACVVFGKERLYHSAVSRIWYV